MPHTHGGLTYFNPKKAGYKIALKPDKHLICVILDTGKVEKTCLVLAQQADSSLGVGSL
jgi:hypothetical protein